MSESAGPALRTLAVTQNITLDGVVDLSEGWFAPGGDDAELAEVLARQAAASDALLVGRVTFEQMRGFWPHQVDDTTGVAAHLDQVAKYVVSSTMDEPGWQRTAVLSGSPRAEVEALKAAPGADIVATGSITLVHELIAADLVDEYRLFAYPVVVGHGRRLFGDARPVRLELRESRTFRSGVVLTVYGRHPRSGT